MVNQQNEQKIDYILLSTLLGLFIISLLAVYSGSGQYETADPFYFVKRQVLWYVVGLSLMAGIALFDFELLKRWAVYLYGIGIGLLILVHFFGTVKNGAQRWISLGFFDLQPSEFMKIFLIIYIAAVLSKLGIMRSSFNNSIAPTVKVILFSIIPFALILVQPDLGSALIIAATVITLVLFSSISIKMIGLLIGGMASLAAFLVYLYQFHYDVFTSIFKPHQLGRIYGWLNPGEYASEYGYQLQQAMRGIGSGQMSGTGFNEGVQVQSGRVPEAHTDFIFAVIGEEFGFIGASILISLYFLLIYRIIMIAVNSNSLFGVYICIGTVGLIAFQVFQNIAMTIGLMPITGLALPFISYGGSALLTNMMALGLVMSVHARTKRYMFGETKVD
ncbi:rod shape-determining protein RodA [Virgibacillus kimchii]